MSKPKDAGAKFEAALRQGARPHYVLRLYVAGTSALSKGAIVRLKNICESYLQGRYELEVVDVYQQPALARAEDVVAVPTLIRRLPLPLRRLIGDLSNEERVLVGLEVRPTRPDPPEPHDGKESRPKNRRPAR